MISSGKTSIAEERTSMKNGLVTQVNFVFVLNKKMPWLYISVMAQADGGSCKVMK